MTDRAVTVMAGVPGTGLERLDDGTFAYPVTTTDFVKIFRQHGFEVSYDHPRPSRSVVSHNAADVWLPVLGFTQAVLENIPANIIASIIQQYFGIDGVRSKTLHVKFKVTENDGREEEFEANGPGSDVIGAINAFQRRYTK